MGLNERNKLQLPAYSFDSRSERTSCMGSETSEERRSNEVRPIVPCYNGKTLKIHEELVGNGLSAISIKHHKGNCKYDKKLSEGYDSRSKSSQEAKENKEVEVKPRKLSDLCYKTFPKTTGEIPECLKDKMKRRNSFWNVHRPELSKLTWPEHFVSPALLQDFFHNHLKNHGTFCEPLHEFTHRSTIADEELRDYSRLRELVPPRIIPPDEKVINIMEKSRSVQLNDEDLDPETQVHKSRAEFCVTIGEYVRRPTLKRTTSQQMPKCAVQATNRFESLPVQHEGLLSKETMISEERISSVIGSTDMYTINPNKKSTKFGSPNAAGVSKRVSLPDSQRMTTSRNSIPECVQQYNETNQVTEDSGDPARLRTILSPRDEGAEESGSRHYKV